jgi:two-component system sensor histidine kinase/response regulator
MSANGTRTAVLIFAAFSVVAAFVIAWFPWREERYARAALAHKAENQAALIAYTIAPALEFGDTDMIREVFRGAARDVDFVGVSAEDVAGATLVQQGEVDGAGSRLVVGAPIESVGGALGTLRLAMSTSRVERESQENFVASFLIGMTILGLGALIGFWVARSIRRIAALTEENASALASAQQAEVKSRFLANMSHEIRTPLNGVLGLADVLSRRRHDPQSAALIFSIVRSGKNLLTLVNDVLDLARIESGRLEIEHASFDPELSAITVCESLMSNARSRGLDLALDVAADVPATVEGDRLRIEQVMTNLVGNALKFTERGRVIVSLRWDRATSELHVAVSDSGIGIPAGKLETIFEAFSQADASTTRRFGGTGLGLTISRELVRKMGGDLRVESVEGEGSTFSFDVKVDAIEPPAPAIPARAPSRIVFVTEDRVLGGILAAHVARCGATLEAVEPSILTEALEERPIGTSDLVVWDARLSPPSPEVRATLASAARRARLLVHASIVDDSPIDDLSSGALPRPFSRAGLASAIDLDAAIQAPARPHLSAVDQALRILIAEDDETNRLVVNSFLVELGLRADFVVNGRLALQRIESDPPYDLVLMDCQMPEMDGYEATRRIRALEAERNSDKRTPVIAVTAHALDEERQRALAAGMSGYLTKPLTLESFLGALREHVPGALRETASVRPPSARPSDVRARIAQAFNRSSEEALSGIADAMSRKDWSEIAQLAHRLKGSCLSIGASDAAGIAAQLEERARGADGTAVGELAVQLEIAVVETDEMLRADASPA